MRSGDTLVAWKLDRLGRDQRHLVNLVGDLTKRGIGLRVLAGEGAAIDTTTANDRLMFGFFCGAGEFERELVVERTKVGELCTELSITRQALYRHVDPKGRPRLGGEKLLGRKGKSMQGAGPTHPSA